MKIREEIKAKRRIVIKVGTSTLTYPNGNINFQRFEQLATLLAGIRNEGKEVVLVSSGSIAVGTKRMGLDQRPDHLAGKQAAAAVGQAELMKIYQKFFDPFHQIVAQVLLTRDGLEHDKRRANAKNTLDELLRLSIIPIINENDTVATDEIEFGDNDTLAASVAQLIEADLLIILSDIDGLYTADPKSDPQAELISTVADLQQLEDVDAGGTGSHFGKGGMVTKIIAARQCIGSGIDMILTNGETPNQVYAILQGEPVGTWFKV